MGHTRKTHEAFYRLPQDIYQTAKVSKLLLAINKGKVSLYKGKNLNEIGLSDIDDSDEEKETLNDNENITEILESQVVQNVICNKSKVLLYLKSLC
ncbi:unnamed protein product [Psylliodes chrysocephalus]|uniref:Uncharacterized protein n=1 Tax=Psylliodes chrysocephalus TaxID=3402493 RepID=A0A9P0G6Z7_9CUCU|nr:unnamed protein product [Psylliodes chrysocephala]